MINITPNAIEKIKTLLQEENDPNLKLRVFVQGGGCSGFQYGFTFDADQNEDDFLLDFDTVPVLVDSMSSQYLENCVIDFKQDIMGESFSIDNPQATTTCGCGNSFSI